MKPFLFAVAFGGLASVAVADPLDTLVPEYEAYVDANSPEGAARTAGLAPDRWSDVTPEAIAEQADAARALLEEVQKAETEREIDQAILIRLLDSGYHMGRDRFGAHTVCRGLGVSGGAGFCSPAGKSRQRCGR